MGLIVVALTEHRALDSDSEGVSSTVLRMRATLQFCEALPCLRAGVQWSESTFRGPANRGGVCGLAALVKNRILEKGMLARKSMLTPNRGAKHIFNGDGEH